MNFKNKTFYNLQYKLHRYLISGYGKGWALGGLGGYH